MALDTFTYEPSYGSNYTVEPPTNVVQFGDGYAQIAPGGLNTVAQGTKYDLTFGSLSDADFASIDSFLKSHIGSTVFKWTPPAPANTEVKVRASNYRATWNQANQSKISVTFTVVPYWPES